MKVRLGLVTATFCVVLASAVAAKEPSKDVAGTVVDSGSFGVLINGKRVGTETFSIQQTSTGSVVTSEFKAEQGLEQADQSSELQLTANGELRKYEWKELVPGKTQAVITPKEDFLIESVTNHPGDKAEEQPFMAPASTSILDDYFSSNGRFWRGSIWLWDAVSKRAKYSAPRTKRRISARSIRMAGRRCQ